LGYIKGFEPFFGYIGLTIDNVGINHHRQIMILIIGGQFIGIGSSGVNRRVLANVNANDAGAND